MTRYVVQRRKGRSMRQMVQTRQLAVLNSSTDGQPDTVNNGNPVSVPPRTCGTQASVATHVSTKSLNRNYEELKRKYRNLAIREKRARTKVAQLEHQVDETRRELLNSNAACSETGNALNIAKSQVASRSHNIQIQETQLQELETQVNQRSSDLASALLRLRDQITKNTSLKARQTMARRSRDALGKKVKRAIASHNQAAASSAQLGCTIQYNLKDPNGVIRPEVRDMLRELACHGVSAEHATDTIKIVAEGLGINVADSVSARSVSRLMLEGLVKAYMQIGHELNQANYVSICSDGTTIKNQQHKAKSILMQSAGLGNGNALLTRTLGVHKAAGHTAQQQFDGWIRALDACYNMLSRSPLGQNSPTNSRAVAPKLRGMLTDHASDQKLLHRLVRQWKQRCDRETRAASEFANKSVEERLNLLSDYLDHAANATSDWRTLPAEQKAAYMHDAWFALATQTGEEAFRKLSKEEQFEVDFLAWAGCCMHKEMNAVKGGANRMANAWMQHGINPPIALKNKFEKERDSKSAEGNSKRGAVKLASLAGALFNNKDEKKGYQKTVDDYFEHLFGYSKRFPDTSNTRYGSYCDAAAELLLHLEAYKTLMAKLRDAKHSSIYTNIESNILDGLNDVPTVTELLVLALYAQSIGRPYIRHVRGIASNGLELGPFHIKVKQHCAAVIQNPDLLLASDTPVASATLDGQPWDRPEVLYTAWSMLGDLPNVRQVLVAFFEGALEAWERFTSEFEVDGIIAQATAAQRQSASVPPTNDLSEGALGRCRQMLRRAPTMTDEQRNSRVMWQHNGTHTWAKQALTESDELFARQEARLLAASGASRKRRVEINQALEERAAAGRARNIRALARKTESHQKLDKTVLLEDATYEELLRMKVKDLDCQIDKLRALGDKTIRPKTSIGGKSEKIRAILASLERRRQNYSCRVDIHEGLEVLPTKHKVDNDNISEAETSSEDMDLCFDDEIVV